MWRKRLGPGNRESIVGDRWRRFQDSCCVDFTHPNELGGGGVWSKGAGTKHVCMGHQHKDLRKRIIAIPILTEEPELLWDHWFDMLGSTYCSYRHSASGLTSLDRIFTKTGCGLTDSIWIPLFGDLPAPKVVLEPPKRLIFLAVSLIRRLQPLKVGGKQAIKGIFQFDCGHHFTYPKTSHYTLNMYNFCQK